MPRQIRAVVTMEMQRGICGNLAAFPALREAVAASGVAAATRRLTAAARDAGQPVVHCTFSMLPDRAGAPLDLPIMAVARNDPNYLLHGSPACELLPELDVQPGDIVVDRHHGVSPFAGTELDATLRSQYVNELVVTGVSLNVGITGLVIEAVNLGYAVVVPRDAVTGVPPDYGDAVITNTLSAIARVTTVERLVD